MEMRYSPPTVRVGDAIKPTPSREISIRVPYDTGLWSKLMSIGAFKLYRLVRRIFRELNICPQPHIYPMI